tara:strand:+ start:236 stop:979 length:744 start_codon:yes stop_codon:yes gene_type:complete
METQLKRYYQKNKISDDNFDCKYWDCCKRYAKSKIRFKGPLLGEIYKENSIPRLLFVSLDPGKRKGNEPGDLHPSSHWYNTLYFVWEFFERLSRTLCDKKQIRDRGIVRKKIHPYFAHTNTVKCCLNNGKEVDKHVFEKCRNFLYEELKILDPEILITQGKQAHKAIMHLKSKGLISFLDHKSISSFKKIVPDVYYIKLNNKKILWIKHYHPSSQRYFWTYTRRYYPQYIEEIYNFTRDNYPKKLNL